MCFNKALANRSIAFGKIKITGLADGAVEFFGLSGRGGIALDLPMEGVFTGFDHRGRGWKVKFFANVALRVYIGINATAIGQRAVGAHDCRSVRSSASSGRADKA